MRNIALTCLLVGFAVLAGCNEPAKRANAVEHGGDESEASPQAETYKNMVDNALLADMSVSDMHFLPHRATLSRLGIDRVTRLATLIQAFGGQIRMSSDETDEKLVSERTAAITEFLTTAGIEHADTLVVRDMPGGRGMSATEATAIQSDRGTYQPSTSGGKPQSAAPTGGSKP